MGDELLCVVAMVNMGNCEEDTRSETVYIISCFALQGLCYAQFAPMHKFSIGQLNIYKW
jgi:hypothetical protein